MGPHVRSMRHSDTERSLYTSSIIARYCSNTSSSWRMSTGPPAARSTLAA